MNRSTHLLLTAIVVAAGCHKAPTTDTTQTTGATVQAPPANPDDHGMAPYEYEGVKPESEESSQLPTAGTPSDQQTSETHPMSQTTFKNGEQLITPINQANDSVDLDTTQAIHSMIERDPSLAAAARFVDITTNDGIVSLRGHTRTPGDRAALEATAREAVGVNRVDDDIVVTPNQ